MAGRIRKKLIDYLNKQNVEWEIKDNYTHGTYLRHLWYHLYVESETPHLQEQSRMVITRGWEAELGMFKGYKFLVRRWTNSEELMYNNVIIVTNTVLYT